MIDVGRPSPLWVVASLVWWYWVLQERSLSKPISSTPSRPLYDLLPPDSLPYLSTCPDSLLWWSAIWKYKPNILFSPQLAFWSCCFITAIETVTKTARYQGACRIILTVLRVLVFSWGKLEPQENCEQIRTEFSKVPSFKLCGERLRKQSLPTDTWKGAMLSTYLWLTKWGCLLDHFFPSSTRESEEWCDRRVFRKCGALGRQSVRKSVTH